jgi:hypothetical protein
MAGMQNQLSLNRYFKFTSVEIDFDGNTVETTEEKKTGCYQT